MQTSLPNTLTRLKSRAIILVAMTGLMMIYSIVNVSNHGSTHLSLPSLLAQTVQVDALSHPDIPAPQPVPTPPAGDSQPAAASTSPVIAQQTPVPAPVPQPVPTPPTDR